MKKLFKLMVGLAFFTFLIAPSSYSEMRRRDRLHDRTCDHTQLRDRDQLRDGSCLDGYAAHCDLDGDGLCDVCGQPVGSGPRWNGNQGPNDQGNNGTNVTTPARNQGNSSQARRGRG